MYTIRFATACLVWLCATFLSGQSNNFHLPYTLEKPTASFYLQNELDEISGLTLSKDQQKLLAVQDEEGIIFSINKASGKVEDRYEFWDDGDYEGIELVGQEVFVVKSTGTIYRVRDLGKEGQNTEKYNGFLDKDNDVEGLAYHPQTGELLLACKKKAGEGEAFTQTKAIYSFNIQRGEFDKTPRYLIHWTAVLAYLAEHPEIRKYDKVCAFFAKDKDDFDLSPSGLAIHPMTGDLYLLSSVGKMLMVVSPEGQILHIEKLDKEWHAQPEGLCFDPDGTLYIANESKKNDAVIHRFSYQNR